MSLVICRNTDNSEGKEDKTEYELVIEGHVANQFEGSKITRVVHWRDGSNGVYTIDLRGQLENGEQILRGELEGKKKMVVHMKRDVDDSIAATIETTELLYNNDICTTKLNFVEDFDYSKLVDLPLERKTLSDEYQNENKEVGINASDEEEARHNETDEEPEVTNEEMAMMSTKADDYHEEQSEDAGFDVRVSKDCDWGYHSVNASIIKTINNGETQNKLVISAQAGPGVEHSEDLSSTVNFSSNTHSLECLEYPHTDEEPIIRLTNLRNDKWWDWIYRDGEWMSFGSWEDPID